MIEFTMPSLGADMEAGTLAEWRVKPGVEVKRGDIIADVETQKGLIEVEVFEDGIVDKLMINEGEKVPVGTYTAIEYTIGVDSTRNVSGAQTGALAPSNGMFWSWLTGYIFIKAEGTSPESGASNGEFKYHIGGFKNENNTNAIRVNTQDFPSVMNVDGHEGHNSKIHFYVNAARFWHGGISLQDMHTVHMPGANAQTIATNFQGAFVIHHIH
jgi:pyruvate/2-oxoglutarate dehydrogenase complex dihydrolipoamide acyltransferase (E2) component